MDVTSVAFKNGLLTRLEFNLERGSDRPVIRGLDRWARHVLDHFDILLLLAPVHDSVLQHKIEVVQSLLNNPLHPHIKKALKVKLPNRIRWSSLLWRSVVNIGPDVKFVGGREVDGGLVKSLKDGAYKQKYSHRQTCSRNSRRLETQRIRLTYQHLKNDCSVQSHDLTKKKKIPRLTFIPRFGELVILEEAVHFVPRKIRQNSLHLFTVFPQVKVKVPKPEDFVVLCGHIHCG